MKYMKYEAPMLEDIATIKMHFMSQNSYIRSDIEISVGDVCSPNNSTWNIIVQNTEDCLQAFYNVWELVFKQHYCPH